MKFDKTPMLRTLYSKSAEVHTAETYLEIDFGHLRYGFGLPMWTPFAQSYITYSTNMILTRPAWLSPSGSQFYKNIRWFES